MAVNNETGTIQAFDKAKAVIKKKSPKAVLHVDGVQGFLKVDIKPKAMGIDLLSISGHKIGGIKGTGALYMADNIHINPLIAGGGQQKNMRSGTQNVPGIAGMTLAIEKVYDTLDEDIERIYQLKDYFVKGVAQIPDVKVNGLTGRDSAPHVVSLSVRGVRSEVLLHALEEKGIYVSAGSACSSHKPQPSATLKAIGVDKEQLETTVRFSFSVFTTIEEIDYALKVMYDKIPMLRKYTRKR